MLVQGLNGPPLLSLKLNYWPKNTNAAKTKLIADNYAASSDSMFL